MSNNDKVQKCQKNDGQPKCPWDEMRSGEIGSTQIHPESGMSYRVNLTSEDNRRFLTPLAA